MKTASGAVVALLATNQFSQWELYQITMFGGGQLFFTTAPFPILFGGNLYTSSLRIDPIGSKALAHWKVGLDVDQWAVVISARVFDPITGQQFPDQIGTVPWANAALNGFLDLADVVINRAYFAAGNPTYPLAPAGSVPVGCVLIFKGMVAEVDVAANAIALTINDYRDFLTINMPRNFYQSTCRHTLFDAGCTLSAGAFIKSGAANAGSSRFAILSTAAITPPAGSSGTFALGRLVFTSGKNNTFGRTIQSWDGVSNFTLLNPFPYVPAHGDTFAILPGCNKTLAACTAFNNVLNFGGFPYIPPPEISQ